MAVTFLTLQECYKNRYSNAGLLTSTKGVTSCKTFMMLESAKVGIVGDKSFFGIQHFVINIANRFNAFISPNCSSHFCEKFHFFN